MSNFVNTIGINFIILSLIPAITLTIIGCNPNIDGTCNLYNQRKGNVIAYGTASGWTSCIGSTIVEFDGNMCAIDVYSVNSISCSIDNVYTWLNENYPTGHQMSFYQRKTDKSCYLSSYLSVLTDAGIVCFSFAAFITVLILIYMYFHKNSIQVTP